ncbi:MAG TPA: ribonucleoside-diphosphate reductase subunit alpha [Chloroflexota bacterium]|nr:ribonucleoside-diphosphate reductase subunit alpha [Chloroflexota bacterium]
MSATPAAPSSDTTPAADHHPSPTVRTRDGRIVPFDAERIHIAIEKAYRATFDIPASAALPVDVAATITSLTGTVATWCHGHEIVEVEQIQDEVERALMRAGDHAVARRYILYREEHARRRSARVLHYRRADGTMVALDTDTLRGTIAEACHGLDVDTAGIVDATMAGLYDGMPEREVRQAAILAARAKVEVEPAYSYVAARLLLGTLYAEALGVPTPLAAADAAYRRYLPAYIETGVAAGLLDSALGTFDLAPLAAALDPERDLLFAYMGLQTLYDRYLLQWKGRRIELPQLFWLRVAMGLALGEPDREARAIEFYDLISRFLFTPATPTLFNAGTRHPQLSSCFLTTIPDDLGDIYKCLRDNALLSKWSGGLGNDWSNIRALGARIRGTNGASQGVIPFLKVASDSAVAVTQGGKRRGAVCAYIEPWHLDVEEFLDLRKNTGDDRRRTHDLNTALWIPDLFMQRVAEGGDWTLFSPDEVPDLHELYGRAFAARYAHYEAEATVGRLRLHRTLPAVELWRRILTALYETGHPWLTWKDPANVRSPQDHTGVVHSSNLCTEILLNTSREETAVCNLGSLNLAAHLTPDGQIDLPHLEATVRTAVRMLDNVIDINYYPTPEARTANQRHRPIGLGLMGFQDALYALGIDYASSAAVDFADRSMEAIAYYALLASAELARERGRYASFAGSKWDRGLLPLDTADLLERERGLPVEMDRTATLPWERVRATIRAHGLRNSNILAIAPTATISTIVGASPSIEPTYTNLYTKSNLSGEFTQVNTALVRDLKSRGLWDDEMRDALKYYDGSLQEIDRVPAEIKERYRTAFEIAPAWLIACASRRQKWIDQGQSLNLYLAGPSGKSLHETYMAAWMAGLKSTYYLRTRAATQVEKSTLDINRWGIQPRWMKSASPSAALQLRRGDAEAADNASTAPACARGEECEACQ